MMVIIVVLKFVCVCVSVLPIELQWARIISRKVFARNNMINASYWITICWSSLMNTFERTSQESSPSLCCLCFLEGQRSFSPSAPAVRWAVRYVCSAERPWRCQTWLFLSWPVWLSGRGKKKKRSQHQIGWAGGHRRWLMPYLMVRICQLITQAL